MVHYFTADILNYLDIMAKNTDITAALPEWVPFYFEEIVTEGWKLYLYIYNCLWWGKSETGEKLWSKHFFLYSLTKLVIY